MPATDVGITLQEVARRSLLKRCRQIVNRPQPATTNKFVASVDPSGLTLGAALTLQTAVSGQLLRYGRLPTVSVTDAAFSGGAPLSVSVRVTGFLRGVPQSEVITATATSGSILTATGARFFDQVTSCVTTAITNAASGDALQVGMSGTGFSLESRITNVADVKSIINVANGTEANPTAISASTVNIVDSAIIGITMVATDEWEIQYFMTGDDGVGENGAVA